MRALVQKLSAIQEAALITTIFAGWFIFVATYVVLAGFPRGDGTGFSTSHAVSLVVFETVAFCIAAVVLRWRGWQLQHFLFTVRWRDVLAAVVLLLITEFVDFVIWKAVGRRLDDGSLVKEIVQPGGVSFGVAASGAALAVTLSALVRMLYHTYQGPYGTLSILAFGLLIGWYYWRTRSLGAVVLTHALADLIAVT